MTPHSTDIAAHVNTAPQFTPEDADAFQDRMAGVQRLASHMSEPTGVLPHIASKPTARRLSPAWIAIVLFFVIARLAAATI